MFFIHKQQKSWTHQLYLYLFNLTNVKKEKKKKMTIVQGLLISFQTHYTHILLSVSSRYIVENISFKNDLVNLLKRSLGVIFCDVVVQALFLLSYYCHRVRDAINKHKDIQTWYIPDSFPKSFDPCILRFVSIRVNNYLYIFILFTRLTTSCVARTRIYYFVVFFPSRFNQTLTQFSQLNHVLS